MNFFTPNNIKFIVSLMFYFLYMKFGSGYITEHWSNGGNIDIILVPFIFGIIMYILLSGDDIIRFIYIFFVPLIVQLLLIGDGDPAKPSIEYYVVMYIIVNYVMGGIVTMGASKVIKLIRKSN